LIPKQKNDGWKPDAGRVGSRTELTEPKAGVGFTVCLMPKASVIMSAKRGWNLKTAWDGIASQKPDPFRYGYKPNMKPGGVSLLS